MRFTDPWGLLPSQNISINDAWSQGDDDDDAPETPDIYSIPDISPIEREPGTLPDPDYNEPEPISPTNPTEIYEESVVTSKIQREGRDWGGSIVEGIEKVTQAAGFPVFVASYVAENPLARTASKYASNGLSAISVVVNYMNYRSNPCFATKHHLGSSIIGALGLWGGIAGYTLDGIYDTSMVLGNITDQVNNYAKEDPFGFINSLCGTNYDSDVFF